MNAFETTDELYYRQQGDMTLEPLVTAKSKDTGKDEPLAWAYEYGKARVFQTVLGHAAESIRGDGPATLIRRGCAWAAGRELKPEKPLAAKPVEKRLTFADGKFGKALDARVLPASIEGDERYRKPPITVECWAKLFSKTGFNVLVSTDPKSIAASTGRSTPTPASGVFSAYLPGTVQGEIKSSVDVCDGKWHHLAMTHDGKKVSLFVDGKSVKEQASNTASRRSCAASRAAGHRRGLCGGSPDRLRRTDRRCANLERRPADRGFAPTRR